MAMGLKMPLKGIKILCTRPKDGAEEFRKMLETSGAEVILAPMIEINPVNDHSRLDTKLDQLNKYKGIIFTSANGVKHFFKRVEERGLKPTNQIYAIGEKTEAAVVSFGYNVNSVPESYDSASLGRMLMDKGGAEVKYLFPTGNLSMKQLVTNLKNIDEVVVYETQKPARSSFLNELEILLENKKINCIAFFSPSAVTNFAELYQAYKNTGADIAAIGKTTRERIESIGLTANIVAGKATAESLGEEIIKYYNAG